ncbi:MAG: hypothetical protein JXB39_15905 [Deltaproteobacteria bacterium]|nr:hypothetical protein [Deltaproteobacteria bacterium]
MKPRIPTLLFVLAAAVAMLFAAVSTYDFVQHLDRQLHGIHCSVVPGLGTLDAKGLSGCHAALMSPWSSVFRKAIWGGIPISLPGLAVYAFLLFRGLDLWLNRRESSPNATFFLVIASLLPVVTSIVMAIVSLGLVGDTCIHCVGMYVASFVLLGAALWGWQLARKAGPPAEGEAETVWKPHVLSALEGVGFVLLSGVVYVLLVPDASAFVGACGELNKPDDPYGIMVPIDANTSEKTMIEIMDPLCPACRSFHERLEASGLDEKVHHLTLLMPLDNSCNWMVSSAVHPGACALSEAMLCAGDKAKAVLDWAFDHQEAIRKAALEDPKGAADMVTAAFPELASCVGTPAVRSKVNRSLRWAVSNQLPVLMPQVFLEGVRLCDEDTDLGMDFALSRLIDGKVASAPAAGKEEGP